MARLTTRQISVRLEDGDADALERLAADDGRSLSNYVRRVLSEHVASTNGHVS